MMTFVELMVKEQPDWQSKDLIVLLYEETDYAFAVKEFLDSYYSGASSNPFASRIHGRCGYIRQAIPFIIKDYDFGKISLMIDGVNSQLSDIDFYDQTRSAIKSTGFTYDVTLPGYFRRNPFI
jgi:Gaa1-like, GPI transamidase component